MTDYSKRLHKVIPGGAHTYSRGDDQFPTFAPPILSHGKGASVWCPEGREYLDYGMALRAITLGYANKRVNEAAFEAMQQGNNLTRASITELDAAELLVDLIPSVDMVKFAKNGSNVTTAAVKIARAYTGRKYVCVPRQQPFFSFDDWFIGVTPIVKGIPTNHYVDTLQFDYGDIASLEILFKEYPNQIAAVMMEPATTETPCGEDCSTKLSYKNSCKKCMSNEGNFLRKTQQLCNREGTVFILDEMITGFRWHLQGAQTYFGVEPDLCTFGKGMANGFSVAAVAGKREIMSVGSIDVDLQERTFLLSSTHGGEMCSLGAFIECVKIYKEEDVCAGLWEYGRKLKEGMESVSKEYGLEKYFVMDGPAICLNYLSLDKNLQASLEYRTLFSQEMARHGVLMPWIAICHSHGDRELDITLEATRKALKVYRDALEGDVGDYLIGSPIKPVFRQYN